MRILYAANNSYCSYHQLDRFISSTKNKNYDVKIAAYKKSMGNINIDFTLDALLNFSDRKNAKNHFQPNGNFQFLYHEIKRFAPDLVISDCEIFTSTIALEAGIKLWQASPILLYYALPKNTIYQTDMYKYNTYLFDNNYKKSKQMEYIINNSDRKFVVSHLCDTINPPGLNNGFQYVRPDFVLADLWSNEIDKFEVQSSKIDESIYSSYIGKCVSFICDGSGATLADGFYNRKFSIMKPIMTDMESIICSYSNRHFGLGKMEWDYLEPQNIKINIDNNIKFLQEQLEGEFK